MINALLALDSQLFFLINHIPHSQFFDQLALFFSAVGTWGGVWLVIAIFLFFREEKRDPPASALRRSRWRAGHWFSFASAIVIVGAFINEYIIKTIFSRSRPTDIISGFSFPSTHAVLAFAFAYILSREEPRFAKWFYLLAVFISLSRIYLGVHYPLDIIGGALVGWGVGNFAIKNLPHRKHKLQR